MNDIGFRLYGTREIEPPGWVLTAGPLSVTLQDGNLRTIRFMGHEVLRAVSFLVRDKDWGTCTSDISGLEVESDSSGFSIGYRARFAAPSGANLQCNMRIAATSEGKLSFCADYMADADFQTARAGFAVLHPIVGLSGQPVTVEHADGIIERARWPDLIEPWQPFMNIAAITHKVAAGIEAETRFEGDVFEMEDQRNWTDGSYKTYVRPLALPWPYLVEAGKAMRQSVTVEISATAQAPAAKASTGAITVSVTETDRRLPEIGVGLRAGDSAQQVSAMAALNEIGARHLIAHFDPLAGHDLGLLRTYADIAEQSGLNMTLELAVPCSGPLSQELAGIADLVRHAGLPLDTLFVSPAVDRQSTPPGSQWPDCPPLEDIYAAARNAFPGIRLGGGMLSYFTELNRKCVPGDQLDYISHCTNPIVHAADDLSVMQTFEALSYVVKSVRAIYGGKPYRIGPSTIAMRQNPYGSATKDNPDRSRIPMAGTDPRHNGQFGAAWTLAYAATVAPAGLEMLTLSTLAGPFGLVAGKDEPTSDGKLRPLAHVIGALAALSGSTLTSVATSRPDCVLGLGGLAPDGCKTMLLANMTPADQTIDLGFRPAKQEILDIATEGFRQTVPEALLTLGPYACARITI